jgi:protein ImuB
MYASLVMSDPPVGTPAGAGSNEDKGEALVSTAREFSPRVERVSARAVVCDIAGLERLFGDAHAIAAELRREAADRGVTARVAVAVTRGAAVLLAHARPGVTVAEAGAEAAMLAPLPIRVLDAVSGCEGPPASDAPLAPAARFYRTSPMQELARSGRSRTRGGSALADARAQYDSMMETFERWGVRTLGDLAALPSAQLSARLGQAGVRLQRLARGEDTGPLVPLVPEERFEAHLELEWPIEGLEPLSFVLGRLLEPVCVHLERRGRAAAVLTTTLRLVTRETHVRSLQMPAPMRDARVLRTLALLDLESHPPGAGIDAVTVRAEPTPGRVLQFSLLERALPAPEQLSTLLARLSALMGHDRCGAARLLDTHRPGAFQMTPFAVQHTHPAATASSPPLERAVSPGQTTSTTAPELLVSSVSPAIRRFRHPIPIRVQVDGQRPARVFADRVGMPAGRIDMAAGPWRTSGDWWAVLSPVNDTREGIASAAGQAADLAARARPWNRDEWDVALEDGTLCRIYRDRDGKGWFMEAVMD